MLHIEIHIFDALKMQQTCKCAPRPLTAHQSYLFCMINLQPWLLLPPPLNCPLDVFHERIDMCGPRAFLPFHVCRRSLVQIQILPIDFPAYPHYQTGSTGYSNSLFLKKTSYWRTSSDTPVRAEKMNPELSSQFSSRSSSKYLIIQFAKNDLPVLNAPAMDITATLWSA